MASFLESDTSVSNVDTNVDGGATDSGQQSTATAIDASHVPALDVPVESNTEGGVHGMTSFTSSPDRRYIVCGLYDSRLQLRDFKTGNHEPTLEGHTDCVMDVAFSPDSNHIVSGSDDNTVRIWEMDTGKNVQTM